MTQQDGDDRLVIATPGSRASAIIVQTIAPEKKDTFLEWQRGIAHAAAAFHGYERTEVFPPEAPSQNEWITLIHFKNSDDLDHWLKSDARSVWNTRFAQEFGNFELKKVSSGLGILFPPAPSILPNWKAVLLVVLGLYPLLYLLNNTVMKLIDWMPVSSQILLNNFLCVAILQWGLVPLFIKFFKEWAYLDKKSKRIDLTGAAIIGIILIGFNVLFHYFLD